MDTAVRGFEERKLIFMQIIHRYFSGWMREVSNGAEYTWVLKAFFFILNMPSCAFLSKLVADGRMTTHAGPGAIFPQLAMCSAAF